MPLVALAQVDVAATPQPAPRLPLVLQDAMRQVDAEGVARVWLDPRADTPAEVVGSPQGLARFQPGATGRVHVLEPQAALWMHLRLARGINERQEWVLEFPLTSLDRVTVFQREGNRWRRESAGDHLPVREWPEPGRHPTFRLDLPAGDVQDVLVRIRHSTTSHFPVRLTTLSQHHEQIQLAYMGLGTTFGALLLLILACLAQAWVYRDRIYAWYAAYAFVTALAVAAYTGVASHLLWPGFGALADAPQAMLALMAAGAALLFVRSLIGIPGRYRRFDRAVRVAGYAGFALALLPPFVTKNVVLTLLTAYLPAAGVVSIVMALDAWRRGDVVGRWVFAAFVPLVASVLMGIGRLLGWLPVSFGTQHAVVIAMAFEVPLLLVALSIRARERHGAQIREQALSSQDALTGLLAPHLFSDRLKQVVTRHRRDQESAAVVFIDLVNHARIKDYYGTAVAEQSLLRSVIKLRRLLRDVDTVSRIGEARFGVILEGVSSRVAVTDRAARLIAAGLMPLSGLKPDVTLQFHIAAILLDERPMEAEELANALAALLAGMSPRTRRPIRFVPPEETHPSGLAQDSSLLSPTDEEAPRRTRPPLQAVK